MSEHQAIFLKNLRFTSHDRVILDNITKTIPFNEKVLLLGPNGSGKSTLLKAIAGLLKPQGKISIFGNGANAKATKEQRSIVPQTVDFPPMVTVKELVEFVALHYENPVPKEDLFRIYDIKPQEYAHSLSGGQKRKLALALALLGKPKLLLLDEPEAGLDVQFRESVLNEIIFKADQRKMTIVMATHFFEDALKYFDRIMILKAGRIIFDNSKENYLQMKENLNRLDIEAEKPDDVINQYIKNKIKYVPVGKKSVRLYYQSVTESLRKLQDEDWPGKVMHTHLPTTEDIYLYHIGE